MKVENVVKVFESAAGRIAALRGINLSIKKGRVCCNSEPV
jgi:hypothetical protein